MGISKTELLDLNSFYFQEECLDFKHCMYGKLQLRIEMKQVMSTYDEIEDELLEQLTVWELRKLTCTIFPQILQKKQKSLHAVTRIRTWVTAATTQGPNH